MNTQRLEDAVDGLDGTIAELQRRVGSVERSAEDAADALADVPVPQVPNIVVPQIASLDGLAGNLDRIARLPDLVAHSLQELMQEISLLDVAVREYSKLEGDYDQLVETQLEIAQAMNNQFYELSEKLVSALPEVLDGLAVELAGLYEEEISAANAALLEAADAGIKDALDEVRETALGAAGILKNVADGMLERFKQQVESTISREVEGAVRDVAEAAVEQALTEIAEGMAISQISAQVTAAMSAQLPQLVVAKNAVGAVRKLLKIMRAGI